MEKIYELKSFYDFIVYLEEKFREKINYIHENLIRKGMVKDFSKYPFSSINYSEKIDVIDCRQRARLVAYPLCYKQG